MTLRFHLKVQITVVVNLVIATRFHQHLTVDLVPIDTCRVRRLQNLSDLTRITHKSYKSLQNSARVSPLYLEVLDWNPKCFCELGPNLNSAKFDLLRFSICQIELSISQASLNLNSPFYSLNVLKSWFVQSWAMSNT